MNYKIARAAVFGEIYSHNIGDGIIFESLKWGLEKHGVAVVPCDISLRDGYPSENEKNKRPDNSTGLARQFARFFVRRSLSLRRITTAGSWYWGGRGRFVERFEKDIKAADVVVIGGGQILVDRQLGFPLPIATIVNIARRHRKKIVIFSCGADRRQGLIARSIYRRMAKAATFISVRDSSSKEFLLSLDPKLRVNVHPDVGFLISSVYPATEPVPRAIVGMNIMPYRTLAVFSKAVRRDSKAAYNRAWEVLVGAMLDRGWHVRLMTNGDPLDQSAASKIYQAFSQDERVTLEPAPMCPMDLAHQLQGVTALVATRMHSGIVAYSYGRTVVPICWDKKVIGTWSEADPGIIPIEASGGLLGVENQLMQERDEEEKFLLLEAVKEKLLLEISAMLKSLE